MGRTCLNMTAARYEAPFVTMVPLRCKCWTCPECAPLRKRRLYAQALSGKPITFMTLTLRFTKNITPDLAAQQISHAFTCLVKRLRRFDPATDFQYLAVYEATKQGWPHLHILTRTPWIPKGWLSRQWADLTGSPVVDIRRISDPVKAAAYVAKYIGKAPQKFAFTKRYRFSRHYIPPQDGDDPEDQPLDSPWFIVDSPLPHITAGLNQRGWQLEHSTKSLVMALPTGEDQQEILDQIEMNPPAPLSYLRFVLNTSARSARLYLMGLRQASNQHSVGPLAR